MDREYNGNFNAAIEAKAREYGYWRDLAAEWGRTYTTREQPAYLLSPEAQARRDDANVRRRTGRQAQNIADLAALRDHVALLNLPKRAQGLVAYLFDQSDGGAMQIRPTNDDAQQALGCSRRTIVYAFRDLETAGLGKRSGGRNTGGVNEAAIWTWFRPAKHTIPRVQPPPGSIPRMQTSPADADPSSETCTLVDHESRLKTLRVGTGEPPPSLHPEHLCNPTNLDAQADSACRSEDLANGPAMAPGLANTSPEMPVQRVARLLPQHGLADLATPQLTPAQMDGLVESAGEVEATPDDTGHDATITVDPAPDPADVTGWASYHADLDQLADSSGAPNLPRPVQPQRPVYIQPACR